MTGLPLAAVPAVIPSPTVGVWNLGFLPVRAYALCILVGIVVACWIAQRRLEARGAPKGVILDIAMWAVPFGIVGGRLYHLITTPQPYFGPQGHPLDAVKVWEGGLGIWGAIALGALGAYIGCRRQKVSFLDFCDAAAPGVLVAQAIGRWGNYFNNEIHGAPTDLPWGLRVYEWDQVAGRAITDDQGNPVVLGVFHPTFLYESIFCLVLALVLVILDKRLDLRPGQVFALYIAGYPVGRVFIELMRTDEANHIFGVRVNVWVSILVFLLGVGLFVWFGRRPRPEPGAGGTQERPEGEEGVEGTEGTAGTERSRDSAGSSAEGADRSAAPVPETADAPQSHISE